MESGHEHILRHSTFGAFIINILCDSHNLSESILTFLLATSSSVFQKNILPLFRYVFFTFSMNLTVAAIQQMGQMENFPIFIRNRRVTKRMSYPLCSDLS